MSHEEVYEFEAALPIPALLARIEAFYSIRGLRGLIRDSSRLHFSRGFVLGSLFAFSERFSKQTVSVRISERGKNAIVICRYNCWDPVPNYLIPPRTLQSEVQKLEHFIQGHKCIAGLGDRMF